MYFWLFFFIQELKIIMNEQVKEKYVKSPIPGQSRKMSRQLWEEKERRAFIITATLASSKPHCLLERAQRICSYCSIGPAVYSFSGPVLGYVSPVPYTILLPQCSWCCLLCVWALVPEPWTLLPPHPSLSPGPWMLSSPGRDRTGGRWWRAGLYYGAGLLFPLAGAAASLLTP